MKSEIDRVVETKQNLHKKAVFEPSNTKIMYGPITRSVDKSQWLSHRDFNSTISKSAIGWQPIPLIKDSAAEPFNPTEDASNILRARLKHKEVGRNEWDGYSHSDSIWKHRTLSTNSIRTMNSINGYLHTVNGRIDDFNRATAQSSL